MKIKLLSIELANQIAAGEVVERPASVVKELLENSLDAGATEIKIELKDGGSQLIRIQDNGAGILKEDLPLALARHATSKIHSFDDLISIMSLGFRGEALASVASISRLTLSSKPAEQKEAWSIYAQGREMTTDIKPVAHPNGTTIEVLDLFYNTPARKRFLKSDKTELIHILECIKKIALSAQTATFLIYHNGKLLHHYHRVDSTQKTSVEIQKRKWLSSICGIKFGQNSQWIAHENIIQNQQVTLTGWIYPSNEQNHYFYVNGRAIKDKVILHSIKKAMLDSNYFELVSDISLNYVLFLTLNPTEVDVNVHPTKQEVRFHEARQVHDFIYDAILSGLKTSNFFIAKLGQKREVLPNIQKQKMKEVNSIAYQKAYQQFHQTLNTSNLAPLVHETHSIELSDKVKIVQPNPLIYSTKGLESQNINYTIQSKLVSEMSQKTYFGRVCALLNNQFALLEKKAETTQFFLLSLFELEKILFQLEMNHEAIKSELLLIPIEFKLKKDEIKLVKQKIHIFAELGFYFELNNHSILLKSVPICLRYTIWQQQFYFILEKLLSVTQKEDLTALLWDFHQTSKKEETYTLSDVIQKIGKIEQVSDKLLESFALIERLVSPVDLTVLLSQIE